MDDKSDGPCDAPMRSPSGRNLRPGALSAIKRMLLRRAPIGGAPAPAESPYSVVVVLGAARTGTTLVASYLAWAKSTHPLARESSPLLNAMVQRQRMFNTTEAFLGGANRRIADSVTQTYLKTFSDEYFLKQQVGTLVFRSPALTRYVFELLNLMNFAPTKYVCCLRDPRDACLSIMEWNAKLVSSGSRPILRCHDAHEAAEFFMGYYNRMLRFRDVIAKREVMFVKYEDAVSAPEQTVAALGSFTGLDLSSFNPAAGWPENSHDFQAECDLNFAVTPLYGKAPSTAQIDRHSSVLSDTDVGVIETTCKAYMDEFGYAPAASETPITAEAA